MYLKEKAAKLAAFIYMDLIVYLNSYVPNALSTIHVSARHIA